MIIFKINNNNNTAGREIEGVLVSTYTLCPPVRELIRFLCINQVSSFVVSDSFFLTTFLQQILRPVFLNTTAIIN